jgi:16S rRNA (uracil1498-N3)-methyltransferase
LRPEEEHHLLDVLRASIGDEVAAFDGAGRQCRARVCPATAGGGRNAGGFRVVLEVVSSIGATFTPVAITLIQAIPKGRHMDWIVEKATELGASEIWPVITERCVVRIGLEDAGAKSERWHRVAISAAKQCTTDFVPRVRRVERLRDVLADVAAGHDLFLVGSLQPDARPFKEVLSAARAAGVRRAAVLIGPEGDLTHEEMDWALQKGATPVSFGRRVLRVETAALYSLSVMAYELMDT